MHKRPIYNYPVVPEEGEHYQRCKSKPVTRAELKCDFRTGLFIYSPDYVMERKALQEYGFGSATFFYSKFWIKTRDGREVPQWRENIQQLADAGLYLLHLGLDGTAEEIATYESFLIEKFGERYLGSKGDSELDGGFCGGWFWKEVLGVEELSPQRSKAQAHQEYDRMLDWAYGRGHQRKMSICSLGYGCHYAAEHEARMLGVEVVEKLPSDVLLWCFCRGAAKQYDLFTTVSISSTVDTPWGGKEYYADGRRIVHRGKNISGPDYGFSEGLSKREWHLAYMCGCSIALLPGGDFYAPMRYEGEPPFAPQYDAPAIAFKNANEPTWALLEGVLTPLGRIRVEFQEFAFDHPMRGVPYMPVALMLDYDHGWNPPRHLYRQDQDHVWANIPYSRGDYQIDNFFRWVYPGYELSSYYRDERGYITNTPFGDMYEVILSNASPCCLEKYRAVILLGDLNVTSREGLSERLTNFLKEGGIVVLATEQWPGIPASLAGAEVVEGIKVHAGEVRAADDRTFREADFEYEITRATSGQTLLQTATAHPLVIRNAVGQGTLYLITVRGWGQKEKRYPLLKGIRHVLGDILKELNLVEIEGRPIYYLVNVTDKDNELIVTLINNSPDVQWEGLVHIRDEEIDSFDTWLGHSEADVHEGALRCAVPPNDVRIFKLKAGRSFLPLMFRNIEWEKLGVGIPEVDLRRHPARRMSHL